MLAGIFTRPTTVVLMLLLLLGMGATTYVVIPKESTPDIDIPIFYVNVSYQGISAEDADRLMVQPLQRRLQSQPGLRRSNSRAGQGFAMIQLEFEPGFDNSVALTELRDRVDLARSDLPPGADPPTVVEVDLSLFPVLTVALSGPIAERSLVAIARDLRDRIEALEGVLEVDIAGARDDLMEILVDPLAIESYRLGYDQIIQVVERNNQLIAAGVLDTGAGRIAVSVPGVIEDPADVMNLPVRVEEGTVVRLEDVAEVRQSYRDPEGFARIDGQPTIALEIRKASGANILDTVAAARAIIEDERAAWPDTLQVSYLQDQAEDVAALLGDLENNVVTAILLVMLTIVLALGLRASLLVAIAIPGAFLAGILAIGMMGFTLNIVVLFALILVVGMLVDGALVVVELAERLIARGVARPVAFLRAAQRMAWPIIAATATTLAVFLPLLFWPGTAGQFMSFLPATVIVTLLASLAMALVFVPVLGGLGGRSAARTESTATALATDPDSGTADTTDAELDDDPPRGRAALGYRRLLVVLVRHPGLTLAGTIGIVVLAYAVYGNFGHGVDFFPRVEPEFARVEVQARGDLSVHEADALVRRVEQELLDVPEIATVYARTIGSTQARLQSDLAEDVIGTIQLDLVDWRLRRPASEIIEELRARTDALPGLRVQIREQERGPSGGRPIQIEVGARDQASIVAALDHIRAAMDDLGGFVDVVDDRPLPSVELRMRVDREEAARYGADIVTLGTAVQLLTGGVLLGTYRPDFTDDEVDIRLRFPPERRSFGQLANLRVSTARGLVPIANFVTMEPTPATGIVKRVDGRRVHTLGADVASGRLVDERLRALQGEIAGADWRNEVEIDYRGQAEDQAETGAFLVQAFVLAIFLMLLILVTQFNSLFQAFLVLSAILFSTAGVLIGLLIRQEAFSLVMSGIGIVALAGIVVNNNIVLIDTYNILRARGMGPAEAAIESGSRRLRPVVLTAVTTMAGLMPMVLALTVDFVGRDLTHGAPSTQYWVQLSTAVVGGLFTATLMTVLVTPAMLAWWDGRRRR